MALLVLDTTVLIDVLRGRPAGARLLGLRGSGDHTPHQADCLIAAATSLARARLATGNPEDFPTLRDRVEHWPVGA